jgi:hypothetical protein
MSSDDRLPSRRGREKYGSVDSAPGRSAGGPLFAGRAVRACLALTAELAPTGSVFAGGEARNSVLESAGPVDGSRQADDCDRVAI